MEDHAITALDRPAVDLERARRERDAVSADARRPVGPIVGGVIAIVVLLGVCVGAVLAVLAE